MSFTKLDSGILYSSIWAQPVATRVVWIAFLAQANGAGKVCASRSGMIRLANVSEAEFDAAVTCLEAPDPDSRSPDNEGRRLSKVDGGWMVLNHAKYRAWTYSDTPEAVRKRKERDIRRTSPDKSGQTSTVRTLPDVSASASASGSGIQDRGSGGKGKRQFEYSKTFCEFWRAYPRKDGKGEAWASWNRAAVGGGEGLLRLVILALAWQVKSEQWTRDSGQYIPMPATYLNGRRWEDEPPTKPASGLQQWAAEQKAKDAAAKAATV